MTKRKILESKKHHKSYVWNESDGRNGRATADYFTGLLNKNRTQKSGKVEYTGMILDEVQAILFSCIKGTEKLPQDVLNGGFTKAFFRPQKNGRLSSELFLSAFNDCVRDYENEVPRKYVFSTTIAVQDSKALSGLFKYVNKFGAKLLTSVNLKRKVLGERAACLRHIQQQENIGEITEKFTELLLIQVSGRSVWEAYQSGKRAVDLVRSILNFQINKHAQLRVSSGSRQPVNKILSGILHTIHDSKGVLQTECFWHEDNYPVFTNRYNLSKDYEKRVSYLDSILAMLKRSKLRAECEGALLRYNSSLDQRDWVGSFKDLWSTFEYITDTGKATYDVTLQRASTAFADPQYAAELGKHLRTRRNALVHSSFEEPNAEILIYQLKRLVEPTLLRLLRNTPQLLNMQEFGAYLSQPRSVEQLKRSIYIQKAAIRYYST